MFLFEIIEAICVSKCFLFVIAAANPNYSMYYTVLTWYQDTSGTGAPATRHERISTDSQDSSIRRSSTMRGGKVAILHID